MAAHSPNSGGQPAKIADNKNEDKPLEGFRLSGDPWLASSALHYCYSRIVTSESGR